MDTGLFTQQYSFQKNLFEPANNLGDKKDFVSSSKKSEFSLSRSTQSQDELSSSDKNKKFAEMMNEIKKKEKARQEQEKEKTENASKNTREDKGNKAIGNMHANIPATKIDDAKVAVFQTQRVDKQIGNIAGVKAGDAEISSKIDHKKAGLDSIVALNEEIQRLIEDQTRGLEEGQIEITDGGKNESIKNILALLAEFLNNKDETDKSTAGDADIAFGSILEKIEDISKTDDAFDIIADKMSPEQLAQLQDNIEKYLNNELGKRDAKALEELAAQFIALTPPAKVETSASSKPENSEKATLQTISESSQSGILPKEHYSQERYDARYDARYDNSKTPETPRADINADADIDNIDDKGDFKTALKDNVATNPKGAASNNNSQNAAARLLHVTGLGGSALDPAMTQSTTVTSSQNIQSPLQNSAANVITQSQNAGAQHPATQMVSATIQKAVKAGEDTNIKLKLNPPELGRVEVKMSIDKNNSTKIVLTIEKPDTYALLKQDADSLQRALDNAGLETDGNLSFELAGDNHNFGDGNSKQGSSQNQDGKSAMNSADEEMIETIIDWQVNPETGQIRYNMLV